MELTGKQWTRIEPRYPPRQTCRRRFQQWAEAGVFRRAPEELAGDLQEQERGGTDSRFLKEMPEKLIGDKAYDSDKTDGKLMKKHDVEPAAPPSETQYRRRLRRHKRRWEVERLFAWLQSLDGSLSGMNAMPAIF